MTERSYDIILLWLWYESTEYESKSHIVNEGTLEMGYYEFMMTIRYLELIDDSLSTR